MKNQNPFTTSRCEPRDFQRSRVYAAEQHSIGWSKLDRGLFSWDEAYCFIIAVIRSKRTLELLNSSPFPILYPNMKEFRITMARSNSQRSNACVNHINMAREHCFKQLILHELGHVFTHNGHRNNAYAGHGPEFTFIYLNLVNISMGLVWAQSLLRQFRLRNVEVFGTTN